MEPPPEEKKLRIASFAAHSARGLVRERPARRKIMFAAVLAALVLMICGSTLLAPILDPHQHPIWFLLYWLACGWVTVLALLLALFDLLLVSRDGRTLRQNLQRQIAFDGSAPQKDDQDK